MVAFRRVILALAVLALFASMASADVIGGQSQLTCSTDVAVAPAVRGEGFTEQTGDVTISCTGGTAPTLSTTSVSGGVTTFNGVAVPLVNFTVFYNTNVTSRLFSSSTDRKSTRLNSSHANISYAV